MRIVENGKPLLAIRKIEKYGGNYKGHIVQDIVEAVSITDEKRLMQVINTVLDEHHNQGVKELRKRCKQHSVPYYADLNRDEMIRILEDIDDAKR